MKTCFRCPAWFRPLLVLSLNAALVGAAESPVPPASAPHAAIAGGHANSIAANSSSATISGGDSNTIHGDAPFSAIGGGRVNTIGPGSASATIAGGNQNTVAVTSPFTTIGGGWVNTIQTNAVYATVGGGFANTIQSHGRAATIGGGATNRIGERAVCAVIAGGDQNTIQTLAYQAVIAGGSGNQIQSNSPCATIGGGLLNRAQAAYATIAGGNGNHTEPRAFYATIPGGLRAEAASFGQFAYASGRFAQNGDAQTSFYVLRQITTSAAPTELFLDGTIRRMQVPTGGAWTFDILVIALSQAGVASGFQVRGVIQNERGTTRLIGEPATTPLGREAGRRVVVEADDTGDALVIKVTGEPAAQIRWVANVRTVEVRH